MSWREWLGLEGRERDLRPGGSPLAAIADRLAGLPRERAQLVAAFAAVLARVARADLCVSPEETVRMTAIVRDQGGLAEADAALVVELATRLSRDHGASHDYLATRELGRLAGAAERPRLLHCLFAVAAADDSVSLAEEQEVRQIAAELGFELAEYTAARSAFRDRREVLRGLPGAGR